VQSTLPALPGIRGIFFDLDDTLCAYWDASKAGLRHAFAAHGPEEHDLETLVAHWAAAFREFAPKVKSEDWYPGYLRSGERTRTEQMRLALLRLGISDENRAARLSTAYMEGRNAELRLFPDAIEVLTTLNARFPLGLMTNGPADIQRQEITTLEIADFFNPILIEGEMGEGKPNATVFARAESAMGLGAQELLMVGNSYSHDIRPALERGWRAIWIRRPSDVPPSADGTSKPEEMPESAPAPTAIISELSALLPLLPASS
jgi:putative hydrolase of the HAD superfamily